MLLGVLLTVLLAVEIMSVAILATVSVPLMLSVSAATRFVVWTGSQRLWSWERGWDYPR